MAQKDDRRWIVYEVDGVRERFEIPARVVIGEGEYTIDTRKDANLWFLSVIVAHGGNPEAYKIIGTEGFPPSKAELEIAEHKRLFGERG